MKNLKSSSTPLNENLLTEIDGELVESRIRDHIDGCVERTSLLRSRVIDEMTGLGIARARAERDLDARLARVEDPNLEMESILFEIRLVRRGGEEDSLREKLA